MNSIRCASSRSKVPEDPLHVENILVWVFKLMPEADEALRLAALGHDIDRALETLRVWENSFQSLDEFKVARASSSAEILRLILEEYAVEESLRVEVCRLVRLMTQEAMRDQIF